MRDRYNAFIKAHEVAWELVMAALAMAFIIVGFLADYAQPGQRGVYIALDLGLMAIFFTEFTSRIAASYDRRAYLRRHWIDLVILIPAIREARLLRLLRLLRLVRVFAGVYRALSSIERLASHRSLMWLFSAWLAVAVICSTAFFLAENGANPSVREPADALWWGVGLAAVGYGDVYPVTPEGRLAGSALMILGITLFAAITGTITSYLVVSEERSHPPDHIRQLWDLAQDGAITSEEYDAKKAELLSRM